MKAGHASLFDLKLQECVVRHKRRVNTNNVANGRCLETEWDTDYDQFVDVVSVGPHMSGRPADRRTDGQKDEETNEAWSSAALSGSLQILPILLID